MESADMSQTQVNIARLNARSHKKDLACDLDLNRFAGSSEDQLKSSWSRLEHVLFLTLGFAFSPEYLDSQVVRCDGDPCKIVVIEDFGKISWSIGAITNLDDRLGVETMWMWIRPKKR